MGFLVVYGFGFEIQDLGIRVQRVQAFGFFSGVTLLLKDCVQGPAI